MLGKTRASAKTVPGGPLQGAGELWLNKGCALLEGLGRWQREANGTDGCEGEEDCRERVVLVL